VKLISFAISLIFFNFQVLADQEPKACLEKKIIPCATFFKKASSLKISQNQFYVTSNSKLLQISDTEFILLDGKVLSHETKPHTWTIYRSRVEAQGSFLIVKIKSGSKYTWTQLSGESKIKYNKLELNLVAGQQLDIYPDHLAVPRLASKDFKDWDLEGFSPEIKSVLSSIPKNTWIEPIEMAEVYRSVAYSFEEKKEAKRLERIRIQKEQAARDLKYKELFRMRYYNPELWSEFLNNPDLSP
jgi:hypothetical protein